MEPLELGDPETLGPYRLLARLGAGGMGRVYLARSLGGSTVAVKVVRAELAADPHFRERFRREVEAAAAVNGAWTAPVAGADAEASVPWLATSYVLGFSLAGAVQSGGPLPGRSLQALGAGLAEALASIHAAGLAHRDLKPANVLMAADGPRVIDFGIARAVGGDRLTSAGQVFGSPGYMSPELAAGYGAGPAGDVFCLASVMVFAATGRMAFAADSAAGLLYRVVYCEPDLTGVPPALVAILGPCFAKDPAARPLPGRIAAAFAPRGAAALLGDGWLPAGLAGAIARHAATVLQMDAPPLATRTEQAAGRQAATAPAAARHRRQPDTAPVMGRRRVLLGSMAAGAVALGGGGAAIALTGRHDGKAAAGGGPRGKPSPLPLGAAPGPQWRVSVKAPVRTYPAVAGNLVLVKTGNMAQGASSATMTALELGTGKTAWTFPGIMNDDHPPLFTGDLVVTLTSHGSLAVLDLPSGEATKTIVPRQPGRHFLRLLAVSGKAAYILGTAGAGSYLLSAYDLTTGFPLWEQADGNQLIRGQMGLIAAGEVLITTEPPNYVTCRFADDGAYKWSTPLGKDTAGARQLPYLAGAAQSGFAITARSAVTAWSIAKGGRHWNVPAIAGENDCGPPVVSADEATCYLVMNGNPSMIMALDVAQGTPKWAYGFNDTARNSPALAGGLLFAGSGGATGLYAFDSRTGTKQWSFQDTSATRDEWYLAGPASSATATIVALHDDIVLALPAVP
jgi:outer membrane protein assembly factor BamB